MRAKSPTLTTTPRRDAASALPSRLAWAALVTLFALLLNLSQGALPVTAIPAANAQGFSTGLLPEATGKVQRHGGAILRHAAPLALATDREAITAVSAPLAAPDVIGITSLSNEIRTNTTTTGDQWVYYWSVRTVAVQPDGSFIQVWIDTGGADGQGYGIYGQRFDANGARVGGEFRANTSTAGNQDNATIAVAPDGSFIIAWDGPGSGTDVFAQRYSVTGVPIGDEFLLNTTVSSNQKYPEMDFFPDGTFVAAFVDGAQTVLQRFDTNARHIGQETRISSGGDDVVLDSLTVRPDNSVLLTWTTAGDVYGQLFTSSLAPIGAAQRLNVYTTGTQEYSIARSDGQGRIVVVWESDGQDGSGMGIYGRRYDANFNPLGGEFAITTNTTGNQFEPQLALNATGNFVVTWSDNNNRDGGGGTGESVWMRLFDANGNPVGSEMMVNQSIAGYQAYPVVDINDAGRLVVAWEGNGTQAGQVDSYGVFARRYQLNQIGTTSLSVTPTSVTAGDLVTVTMALTAPSAIPNVSPNPLSLSGTNGVFATLVSGPTPASAAVGATPTSFTWTYRITALGQFGRLTFGGQADDNGENIWPYAASNGVAVMPALFIRDLTAPNLVGDSNVFSQPDQGPRVFTIGAEVCNPNLVRLTDVVVYIGDGVTPGVFYTTTMSLGQTHNTYQGSFALDLLANDSDATRPLIALDPSKPVIDGGVDFNGDGSVTNSDDGILSNSLRVIDGRVDFNGDNVVNTNDDAPGPPAIIDGYVDVNGDGAITAADDGTAGGECRNLYWQAAYQTLDAFGQATWGDLGDIGDDLRYYWTVWGTANLSGITRTVSMTDSARVRNEISAMANRIQPNGGFITGSPPRVIDGSVDVNSDGAITNADDGFYFGKAIINGGIDMNGDGAITAADDGTLNTFPVIDGRLDANRSGAVTTTDDMLMTQTGQTFSITVHNATFGTVGQGYDENRDNLWDFDFWHQPIGEITWDASAFRLIDIQSDITGKGGSCPLNGITTHYDNEPYLTRIFNGDLSSCGFDATYTYTFIVVGEGSGVFSPYQEAASGANNEKYNGDYCGDDPAEGNCYVISTGLPGLALDKTGSPYHTAAGRTVTWVLTYTNVSTTAAGEPGSGNGVVVEDAIPANATFVAGSAACAAYPCVIYYSTDGGATWTSTPPAASSVTHLRWHIEQPVPAGASGTVSFQTTVNAGTPALSRIRNTAVVKIGTGPVLDMADATVCASCVTIDKDTSTPIVVAGSQVTYTIAVRNLSDLPLTGVTISDTLPVTTTGSFTYASTSSIVATAGVTRTVFTTPTVGTTTPLWGAWTINPTGTLMITFVATVGQGVAPGTYDNTTYASAASDLSIDDVGTEAQDADTPAGADPEADEDVTVLAQPELLMDKDTTTPIVVAGGQATYVIVVQNTGDSPAVGVMISDTLPAGFTYASTTSAVVSNGSRTSTSNPTVGAATPTWGTWTLNPGGAMTLTFTVDVARSVAPGIYDNTANAGASNHATIDDDGTVAGDADTLPTDTPETDEDVQVVAPGAIGDYVWYDADGDGIEDVAEPGIANVTLRLYRDTGNGSFDPLADTLAATTTTDADGGYLFSQLAAGVYFVRVTDANGVLVGLTHIVGGQSQSTPTGAIVLGPGQVYKDADFGYYDAPGAGQAQVGDTVWYDANGDGFQQPGEPGIPGVTVVVTDSTGTRLGSDVTDSNGRYLIEAPAGGGYSAGPDMSAPGTAAALAGLIPTTAVPAPIPPLAAGQQYLAADFGYRDGGGGLLGTLGNLVFYDADQSGTYTSGDWPLGGVSVDLIRDTNGNGAWDAGEPIIATVTTSTTVGANTGNYLFTGVPGGKYLAHVSDTNAVLNDYFKSVLGSQPGQDNNNQADPYAITLAAGGSNLTADFGYVRASRPNTGVIGNQVWLERDGNGLFAPADGDLGVAGVTVALLQGGAVIATTTTGASGDYSFTGLPAGTYAVTVTDVYNVMLGYDLTALGPQPGQDNNHQAQPYPVVLPADGVNLTADFGYITGSGGQQAAPNYRITKTLNGSREVRPGSEISFTIQIINTGDSPIIYLPLRDTYDADYLTYGFGDHFAMPDSDDRVSDGVIHWANVLDPARGGIGTLPSNGSAVIVVYFTARADTSALVNKKTINVATVTGAWAKMGVIGPNGTDLVELPPKSAQDNVGVLNPTGIAVVSFRVTTGANGVTLTWQTANEAQILGFNVYRTVTDGVLQRVNPEIIPAEFAGSNQGTSYSLGDGHAATIDQAYVLEVVELSGRATRTAAVEITTERE